MVHSQRPAATCKRRGALFANQPAEQLMAVAPKQGREGTDQGDWRLRHARRRSRTSQCAAAIAWSPTPGSPPCEGRQMRRNEKTFRLTTVGAEQALLLPN